MWSIAKLLGVEIAVPSFSTLWHRGDGLALRANGSGIKNLYFISRIRAKVPLLRTKQAEPPLNFRLGYSTGSLEVTI